MDELHLQARDVEVILAINAAFQHAGALCLPVAVSRNFQKCDLDGGCLGRVI